MFAIILIPEIAALREDAGNDVSKIKDLALFFKKSTKSFDAPVVNLFSSYKEILSSNDNIREVFSFDQNSKEIISRKIF